MIEKNNKILHLEIQNDDDDDENLTDNVLIAIYCAFLISLMNFPYLIK